VFDAIVHHRDRLHDSPMWLPFTMVDEQVHVCRLCDSNSAVD
jgi:hypothetical protein